MPVTEKRSDDNAQPQTQSVSQPVVQLAEVHKRFGSFHVLRGVTLEVRANETVAIIGRSGTGKSVTIRHIVGLEQPDSGSVRVFNVDLQTLSKAKRLATRLRMGYLFQSGALLNWMTVAENVELPLLEHRRELRPQERRERVYEKLRLVHMEDAGDKFPSEISGGMKKRAALARATVLDPEIILYDEPTSGLDPVIANTINELIVDTSEAIHVTQIVVTHDMESAYMVADRIAMLFQGQIIACGSPQEIRESDNPVVQQFIHGRTRGPITDNTDNTGNTDNVPATDAFS